MPDTALIGLAHGSRDPRSAQAIDALMAAAGALLPGVPTRAAFLDLNPPDLTTVTAGLDVARAVVLPLLFSEAFHARTDVPQAMADAARSTGAALTVAPILGLGEPVLAALAGRAADAGIGGADDVLLVAVGSSRPEANEAVVDLAATWSKRRVGEVHAAFATCEPRAVQVLAGLRTTGRTVSIVPLFLAPGLLLDQVAGDPAATGCRVADVLGTTLAGLIAQRYRDALLPG